MKLSITIILIVLSSLTYCQKDTTLYGLIDSVNYRGVEILPSFPGGNNWFTVYLKKNVKYPGAASKKNISGTVIVEYTLTPEGKAINPTIYKSDAHELDKEAIRLIQGCLWIPAIQLGQKVFFRRRTPIIFNLDEYSATTFF